MRFSRYLAAFAFFSTVSCAGVPRYVNPDPTGSPAYVVHLFVDRAPGLSTADALRGCEVWREKGVACVLVDDTSLADIRVYADMRACLPNPDGRRTLALAYKGGRVEFRLRCMMDGDAVDLHEFRAVMAHEVGHQLGIWEHVPEACEGAVLRHPSGASVCGRAIMNPYYDPAVHFMTPVDGLAFDLRDPDYSVLIPATEGHAPPKETPDCVYRSR